MTPMKWMAGCLLAASAVATAFASDISAEEIVARNAAARGGVEAWRKVQTMAWTGHAESTSAPGRKMPFLLEQMRPNKTRFELVADSKKSIRIYDGSNGWKLRPNATTGVPESIPYSDEESKFARGAQVIDGPLMEYVAKGGAISFAGYAQAEGRNAYILDVKLPSGGNHRVWVDAQTFLEVRHDRQVNGASGQLGVVTVVFRDYHDFEGLQMPTTIETGAGAGGAQNKLVIERVALNPKLDERMFVNPNVRTTQRRGVTIDTRGVAASPLLPAPQ
jgi:outer membrane lipoprotein-sorting protein